MRETIQFVIADVARLERRRSDTTWMINRGRRWLESGKQLRVDIGVQCTSAMSHLGVGGYTNSG